MRTTPLLLIGAAILAACSSDSAITGPSARNLHPMTPAGWSPLGGFNSVMFIVGIDNITTHTGHGALAILGTDTNSLSFGGIGQYIKADDYRGKRVRLTAWVRHENLVGVDVGLWMRVDGVGAILAFDNSSTRSLFGTADWHQVQIVLDVSDTAVGIALGALMSGKGELWVDDMMLEVVPATGPTTDLLTAPVPSATDVVSLYANAPRSPTHLNFEP